MAATTFGLLWPIFITPNGVDSRLWQPGEKENVILFVGRLAPEKGVLEDAEGQWVLAFFGPWLQPNHPKPAKPGEIRHVGVVDGKDVWVDGPEPFVVVDGAPCSSVGLGVGAPPN